MYKNYNMTQLTLPIETSVRIPQNDISRYVNEIVETKTEKAQDSLNDNTTKTMTSDKPEDNQPK